MGLVEIKEKVLGEAKEKAEAGLRAARQEAEEIRTRGEQAAKDLEKGLLRKARQDADARKERHVTEAHLAARKAILAEKQKAIEDVFRTALESFAASKDDVRSGLKKALLQEIETGEETLSLPPSDRDSWGADWVHDLNRELEGLGRKGAIRLADSGAEIASGVVLHRPGVEVNLSLEEMMREVRERMEEPVAKFLFGAEGSSEPAG